MLRAFFGHHRTASTWVRNILNDISVALHLDQRTIHTAANYAPFASLREMIEAEHPDLVTITAPKQEVLETLPPLRGFHVIRDPRDILVSAYFSHLHSHPISFGGVAWPELAVHREALQRLDREAGILREIEFIGSILDDIAGWNYRHPGMLEVKMEDLVAEPLQWWRRILTHLDLLAPADRPLAFPSVIWNLAPGRGVPRGVVWLRRRVHLPHVPLRRVPPAYLPWMVERYSFARLSRGRQPGQEDVTSHYRRGVAGDWRNHLTDKHLDAFRDRFGDLVERLGYQW